MQALSGLTTNYFQKMLRTPAAAGVNFYKSIWPPLFSESKPVFFRKRSISATKLGRFPCSDERYRRLLGCPKLVRQTSEVSGVVSRRVGNSCSMYANQAAV